MPRSRCSRSILKLRCRKSTPTGRRTGGSRLSLMSVFLALPPLNQRPRPGVAASVTMGPMARTLCNAPRAPVIVRRSPRRMSPPDRNRSATSCTAWEGSSGHRENLLRLEVTAVGVAMARTVADGPIGPSCSVSKRLTRKSILRSQPRWEWKKDTRSLNRSLRRTARRQA